MQDVQNNLHSTVQRNPKLESMFVIWHHSHWAVVSTTSSIRASEHLPGLPSTSPDHLDGSESTACFQNQDCQHWCSNNCVYAIYAIVTSLKAILCWTVIFYLDSTAYFCVSGQTKSTSSTTEDLRVPSGKRGTAHSVSWICICFLTFKSSRGTVPTVIVGLSLSLREETP